jgi:hypothetical protein
MPLPIVSESRRVSSEFICAIETRQLSGPCTRLRRLHRRTHCILYKTAGPLLVQYGAHCAGSSRLINTELCDLRIIGEIIATSDLFIAAGPKQ